MVYSTIIQTYICSRSHYTFIGGRSFSSQKKSATPPATISNSFLLQTIKNVLDHTIINKKQFVKLLIIKTNKYLSYISESIIMIIGKCYMCALCLVYGVQRAILV
jgi:methylaspartate ammonia-lyase